MDNRNVTTRSGVGLIAGVILVWILNMALPEGQGVPSEVAVAIGSILSWAAMRFIPPPKTPRRRRPAVYPP